MLILVTNDDGYRSEGIAALATAAAALGDVVVVAPVDEASAIGHALTGDVDYLRRVVASGRFVSIDQFKPGREGQDEALAAIDDDRRPLLQLAAEARTRRADPRSAAGSHGAEAGRPSRGRSPRRRAAPWRRR